MRDWENNIRRVVPYTPGEQPKNTCVIKLNTNENPYPPAPGVKEVLSNFNTDDLRLYPDPRVDKLVNAIADFYKIDSSKVFVGVGSDDVLAMIFMTFFNSKKPILFPDLVHTTELTSEKYGVGCRKGSDLASYINSVFAEAYADGSAQEIAKKYGVQDSLLEQEPCEFKQSDSDSDVDYIKSQGKMIVGITEFEPMDYKDKDDKWIGFDADMARLVGKKLGVDVEFVVIDWDNKVMELDSKKIDVVWNGMTLTDEVTKSMECTNAYCNNAQVVVEREK